MQIPGGRLTLTSGTPVTTSDVTGATNIYYTPYVSNKIELWDGTKWVQVTFTETTKALGTLSSTTGYDIFAFLDSNYLFATEIGPAWTSGTARSTGVVLTDGRYTKSGDKSRLYLGSFYTTSTTTTEDSAGGGTTQVGGKRFLWNAYNQVPRYALVADQTDSWTYATNTWRLADGASTPSNCVEIFIGLDSFIEAEFKSMIYLNTTNQSPSIAAKTGIGLDSTSTPSGLRQGAIIQSSNTSFIAVYSAMASSYRGYPGIGYHYLSMMEKGASTLTNSIFLGDNGADGQQTGLYVTLRS